MAEENKQLLNQKIEENKKMFEENQKLILRIQEKQKKITEVTLMNTKQPSTI